jgi:hypothetical protein
VEVIEAEKPTGSNIEPGEVNEVREARYTLSLKEVNVISWGRSW